MSNTSAIRLTRTSEVESVLKVARKRYPTLNDPEIFKLALSYLVQDKLNLRDDDLNELEASASFAVGSDYLSDPEEDTYRLGMGKKVKLKKVKL